MYESELARSLVPYTPGEQPKVPGLIKLNTNENPYPPSENVRKAIAGEAGKLRLYPDMNADGLRDALAQRYGLTRDEVFCGNGSDEVLAFAFAAFFARRRTYSLDLTYSFYPVYADLFGVDLQRARIRDDFTVPVEELLRDGPVVLANPNAPTSLLLPEDQIERILRHAASRGNVVLVDEAYAEFACDNALRFLKTCDNLLIVRTFSKSHSLAGLRAGYALGAPGLIASLQKVRDSFNSYPLDRLAQAGAEAAVRDEAYTQSCLKRICATRDRSIRVLRENGITVLDSQTNFLLVKAHPEDALDIQKKLREEGILVRYFSSPRLRPYLRVTVGTGEDMERVTERLCFYCRS